MIEKSHEIKLLPYEELMVEVLEWGYGYNMVPFETGCRGFSAASLK